MVKYIRLLINTSDMPQMFTRQKHKIIKIKINNKQYDREKKPVRMSVNVMRSRARFL